MLIMEVQHRVGDSASSKPLEDYLKENQNWSYQTMFIRL